MLILAGLIFTILMFAVLGVCSDMEFWYLVDIPTLLIIGLPLAYFFLATQSGKIINLYILSSFKRGYKHSKTELESIIIATKNIIKFTLAMGLFCFIFGLYSILSHTYFDEEFWLPRFMINMQVNFLVLIYPIAVSLFIFFPVKVWAENKIRTSD